MLHSLLRPVPRPMPRPPARCWSGWPPRRPLSGRDCALPTCRPV